MNELTLPDKNFLDKISEVKIAMQQRYLCVSKEATKEYDSDGNKIIRTRDDGYDYLEESYMRAQLDKHFPGWSWENGRIDFLGGEWVYAQGQLCIIDEYLLAFGIYPPIRKFFGADAARITYQSAKPHTPEFIVDIGNNIKGANSKALKVAINRMCHIGDDVYGKRFDDEGSGTFEQVLDTAEQPVSKKMVLDYISRRKMLHSRAMSIAGVSSWAQVTDWKQIYNKLKEA